MPKRRSVITKEMVQAAVEEMPGATRKKICRHLRCHEVIADEYLKKLKAEGLVSVTPNGKVKRSFLFWPVDPADVPDPVPEPSVANVYVQPFRPLTGYDPLALQRQCEGSRNPSTGMS